MMKSDERIIKINQQIKIYHLKTQEIVLCFFSNNKFQYNASMNYVIIKEILLFMNKIQTLAVGCMSVCVFCDGKKAFEQKTIF